MTGSQKQRPLDVLRGAAKRLFRVVTKHHPKLEKRLPKLTSVKSEQADAEQFMLAYLAQLSQTVEELLPDHEGAVSEVSARRFKVARPVETVALSCITLTSRSARRVRCVKDVTSQAPRAKPTRFESSPNISRNRSSSN
ncbi:hypothetical protein PAALTS15_25189 [Paenibacillus alvei TS-15]|uniref:Uncharacterized protein n=1 Tax=Paenibacillus alvei TS-15 TaxID=1117108 RepID=S9U1K2_PAEAL|nr:hypothetical protein PAALTS15_25189 [Paenibacillus alvei TS-15]